MSPDIKITDEVWSSLSKTQRKRAKKKNKTEIIPDNSHVVTEPVQPQICNNNPISDHEIKPIPKMTLIMSLKPLTKDDPLIIDIKSELDKQLG